MPTRYAMPLKKFDQKPVPRKMKTPEVKKLTPSVRDRRQKFFKWVDVHYPGKKARDTIKNFVDSRILLTGRMPKKEEMLKKFAKLDPKWKGFER